MNFTLNEWTHHASATGTNNDAIPAGSASGLTAHRGVLSHGPVTDRTVLVHCTLGRVSASRHVVAAVRAVSRW